MFEITLVLALAPGKPDGDLADRILMRADLTPHGALEEAADGAWWAERTRPDGSLRPLDLIRLDGEWSLRSTRHEDEPLWRVEARWMRPGDYVTLHQPDGDGLIYRVVGVEELPQPVNQAGM